MRSITTAVGLKEATAPWGNGTCALPEITGGGIVLFDYDYDKDGDLDLLQICFPPPSQPEAPASNRLFQQQRDETFLDVTATAGLGDPGYGPYLYPQIFTRGQVDVKCDTSRLNGSAP